MASPPEITLKDLTGTFVMNKTISDDTDAVLALQGVPWLKRRAIGWATVTLCIKQYTDDSVVHIDIEQTATGGIKGTTENRSLDWVKSKHSDHVFGNLEGQSEWVGPLSERWAVLDEFLKEAWLEEGPAGPNGEVLVHTFSVNEERGWDAQQIWGFSEIEGERYYTRRVIAKKGDEVLKVRLVYDYHGKN